jgi:hypothetical protein
MIGVVAVIRGNPFDPSNRFTESLRPVWRDNASFQRVLRRLPFGQAITTGETIERMERTQTETAKLSHGADLNLQTLKPEQNERAA